MTAATTTTTTTTAVDRLLEVVVGTRSPFTGDVFAADAVLDAVVPRWRFSVTGDQIGGQLADWFEHPGVLEELERHRTATGEVVAYTVVSNDVPVPFAARQVHVLTVEDDRIVRDQFWCGGRWTADVLAEMEAAGR